MFDKVKTNVAKCGLKTKAMVAAGTVTTTAMALMPMVFATDAAVDPKGLIGRVLGVICDLFLCIGILLLAWSAGMLFLAFKNEDADSKSRAMMMMVVSVVLIGFKAILNGVLGTVAGIKIGEGFL